MKKQNVFNIILGVIIGIALLVSLGFTIYQKVDEKNKTYSYDKMLKIYNSITYNEKMNLYLFYGDGCPHCANEEEFFKSISSEYKDKYNLVKFETWDNQNNRKLKELVVDKMVEEGLIELDEVNTLDSYHKAVPLLIIGDKVFLGYSNKMNDTILTTIDEQQNNEYDVMKKLDLK